MRFSTVFITFALTVLFSPVQCRRLSEEKFYTNHTNVKSLEYTGLLTSFNTIGWKYVSITFPNFGKDCKLHMYSAGINIQIIPIPVAVTTRAQMILTANSLEKLLSLENVLCDFMRRSSWKFVFSAGLPGLVSYGIYNNDGRIEILESTPSIISESLGFMTFDNCFCRPYDDVW